MAELNPLYLDGLTYPAKEDRKILGDIYTEGILTTGALAVTQSGTPAMSVSVAAGRAVVTNDEGNFGKYIIENDAAVTKTIAASDPSNPRIDRIIGQLRDATDISGADNDWQLQVLTGTPAASPAAPALPSNALDIALVAVAANAATIVNANITNQRVQSGLQSILLSKSKIITTTRDLAAASGDVSYTGLDFTPTSIQCIANTDGSLYFSNGFADSSKTGLCLTQISAGNFQGAAALIQVYASGGGAQTATIKTYDANVGFTLTWAKYLTPTGTIQLRFLCIG